MLAKIVLAFIH